MKDLILVSHGNLSKELKKSVEMIMGPQNKIHTLSLKEGESPDEFGSEFKELTSNLDDYVVFADLLGGTPCNVVTNIILSNNLNLDIFTGMNMPMIVGYINSAMTDQSPQPVQSGKDGITYVNEIVK